MQDYPVLGRFEDNLLLKEPKTTEIQVFSLLKIFICSLVIPNCKLMHTIIVQSLVNQRLKNPLLKYHDAIFISFRRIEQQQKVSINQFTL